MDNLVIYGGGGAGRGCLQIAVEINNAGPTWNVLGFLEDDHTKHGQFLEGKPVVGDFSWLKENPQVYVVIGIASPSVKQRIVERLLSIGHTRFATLIHPRAWLADNVIVGFGSVIYALAACNTGASIGEHVLVNMNSTVGHDAILKDYCTLAPGARVLGAAHIGQNAELGANSVVLPHIKVGSGAILGAGAVATKDIPQNALAVGVPAVCKNNFRG